MREESIARGTLVLTVASFFNRFVGFALRILLIRIVGSEGIGLFVRASSVYVFLLSFASAGVPVAVAKLIAEERASHRAGPGDPHARRAGAPLRLIVDVALGIILVTCIIMTIFYILAARSIADFILKDPRTYAVMLCTAPALLVVGIDSAFRGCFQGLRWMEPIALSQTIERVVSAIVSLCMAYILIANGLEAAAAGISLGMVAGESAGLATLFIFYRRYVNLNQSVQGYGSGGARGARGREGGRNGEEVDLFGLLGDIFRIAVPVAVGRIAASAAHMMSAFLIPLRLQAGGMSLSKATSLYGDFAGVGLALVSFPTIFTIALSANLVPAVSSTAAERDYVKMARQVREAVRVTLITGLPLCSIFYALANPLCRIVFSAPEAGPVLSGLAIGAVFMYIRITTSSILQGLGMATLSVVSFIAGSLADFVLIYLFGAEPLIGIHAAVIGFGAGAALNSWINLRAISRKLNMSWNWPGMIWSPVAGCAMLIIALPGFFEAVFEATGSEISALGVSLFAAIVFYGAILVVTGAVHIKAVWMALRR
ncbi:MAG: polysaccharide biosynthesis protein [Firmicutes bacterium]|nr:polysaccharide biosynthesis protein [Bacillota bacterium]